MNDPAANDPAAESDSSVGAVSSLPTGVVVVVVVVTFLLSDVGGSTRLCLDLPTRTELAAAASRRGL